MSEDRDINKINKHGNMYPKVGIWAVMKEYLIVSKPYTILAILSVISFVIAVVSQSVIAPIYYKTFFDTISGSGDINSISITLINIVFMVLGLNIIAWFFHRIAMVALSYYEANTVHCLYQKAFDYLTGHSFSFFTNNFAGSLVQKINRFARSFIRIADRILIDLTPLVIKIIGASIVLYLIKPILAVGLICWATIFLIVSFFFSKFKLKYDIKGASLDSKQSGAMSDTISNYLSVQLFTGEKVESGIIMNIVSQLTRVTKIRWNLLVLMDGFQGFLAIMVEFIFFYYGIKYWQMGLMSIGTFALIQTYIIIINGSLWGFGRIVRDLYEATADAKQMVEILHLPHEIKDIPNAKDLNVEGGSVEFKDLVFAFDQNKPVFNKLNISIKAGEKVALIGHSGAGKSTLVKLLLRLHDIQGGEILIDNQNIKNVTQKSLRENMSLVPQDPALFHRTLMDNIRYGKRDSSDEEVIQASRLAHCDIFINEFTNKYETFVGERGVKLSGGERQRVAIARALLKNAPILILDEATSSLDSHSESLIQDALDTLMRGKTTLVIAHRLSTIKKMDRIIVLGKEGIIEDGSHEELLKKDSAYAKLWNLQAGGFVNKNIDEIFD